MNVLVTGATGQLGLKVTNFLLESGINVKTLGRKEFNNVTPNYSWSLGMSPNPEALMGIDCILHFAWNTTDRGVYDLHLNVGGSNKIIEAAVLSKIRLINFSSFSALNPISGYGLAKQAVEESNSLGLNLRIAKLELRSFKKAPKTLESFLKKFLYVPVPRDLAINVIEIDQFLNEISNYINQSTSLGTHTLPYESYRFSEYLKKYHGLKSFYFPKRIISLFFYCCKVTHTRRGKLLYDRWLSLVSTNQALG